MLEGDDMHVSQVPADEEQHNVAAEAAGEAAYETPAPRTQLTPVAVPS